jgi:prepilin-type processing-associated H-X9-DG protein
VTVIVPQKKILSGPSPAGGFALLGLLTMLPIMALLAMLFVSTLARGRGKTQETVCLNNLRELAIAAHLYSAQNQDRWIGNGPFDPNVNLPSPPPAYVPHLWVAGAYDLSEEKSAEVALSEKYSLIAPFLKTARTLKCPADATEIRTATGTLVRARNYGMNIFFGWNGPPYHDEPIPTVKTFRLVSATTRPKDFFLFGEIHAFSICHPHFGVHPNNALKPDPTACDYYHLPAKFHRGSSTFSFADGHVASHRWRSPLYNNPNRRWDDGFWHGHAGPHPELANDRQKITADSIWLGRAATELR